MDNFDLKPEPKVKRNRSPIIWNILTILILLAACYMLYYVVSIFINPMGNYNPFPPRPLPTLYQTPTSTATVIQLPPTWTPTTTPTPNPTRTKAPTWTAVSVLVTPSATLTPAVTASATIASAQALASVAITYQASTTIHPELACNWMGVGGKVLDAAKSPLLFQTIQMGGSLNGSVVSDIVLSGSSPAYGTSGFEFSALADHPIASTHTLWVQLFDNNGKPLTDKVYFDTLNDCTQNLVTIIFTKN